MSLYGCSNGTLLTLEKSLKQLQEKNKCCSSYIGHVCLKKNNNKLIILITVDNYFNKWGNRRTTDKNARMLT